MIIHKILRNQVIREGTIQTDYQVSDPVNLDILNILSQETYAITGYQYLSPEYLIQKPDGIQISGILHSNVLWVTYPQHSAQYIEEYLSELLSLVPEQIVSVSFLQIIYEDLIVFISSKIRRKAPVKPEMNEFSQITID